MKKNIFFVSLLMLLTQLANAQSADYKAVFDLTSKDSMNQQSVLRELGLIKQANPDAMLEVVIYGQGLDLVTTGKSTRAADIRELLMDKNISFKVCAMAMKHQNVDKSQLLPGVEVVPDGIYEIISKQHEGWGYIKVAR